MGGDNSGVGQETRRNEKGSGMGKWQGKAGRSDEEETLFGNKKIMRKKGGGKGGGQKHAKNRNGQATRK